MKKLIYGHKGEEIISNLYSFLQKTDADELVIRTMYVDGRWQQNMYLAEAAGYNLYTGVYRPWAKKGEFSGAYFITRK